jgi:hypothetical protein
MHFDGDRDASLTDLEDLNECICRRDQSCFMDLLHTILGDKNKIFFWIQNTFSHET